MKVLQSKNTYKRIRLLLNGNILYRLYLTEDSASLYDENPGKFFTSFRVDAPVTENFVVGSKANMLLNDLASSDSTTRTEAFRAIWSAPFAAADVPLLQEALYKSYILGNNDDKSNTLNYRIAEKLEALDGSSTVAFVTTHYKKFKDNNEGFNNLSHSVLAGIHTKESYDALVKMLVQARPKEPLDYMFETKLRDSLA